MWAYAGVDIILFLFLLKVVLKGTHNLFKEENIASIHLENSFV